MFGLPSSMISSAIRWGLGMIGATLVHKGIVEQSALPDLIGALMSLGALMWGQYTHYQVVKNAPAVEQTGAEAAANANDVKGLF